MNSSIHKHQQEDDEARRAEQPSLPSQQGACSGVGEKGSIKSRDEQRTEPRSETAERRRRAAAAARQTAAEGSEVRPGRWRQMERWAGEEVEISSLVQFK